MKIRCLRGFRPPSGAWFVLAVTALMLVLVPFRMPPLSRSRSLAYYKLDGSKTAQILRDTPSRMQKTLSGNGYIVSVDAPVEYPNAEHISIYKAVAFVPDAQRIQGLFFPENSVFEEDASTIKYSSSFIDYVISSYRCDTGYFRLREDGVMHLEYFSPFIRIGDSEDVRALLLKAGFPVEGAEIQLDEAQSGYTVTMRIDGLPLSDYPAFDASTGRPSDGIGLVVGVRDGLLRSITGSVWTKADMLWKSTAILPLESVLDKLQASLFANGNYDSIRMAYHTRTMMAEPREALLYPVWEMTNSLAPDEITVVNAITGDWELFLMGEEGGTEEDETYA